MTRITLTDYDSEREVWTAKTKRGNTVYIDGTFFSYKVVECDDSDEIKPGDVIDIDPRDIHRRTT